MTEINFGFNSFETTLPEWSKHHKEIGLRMRRTYEDGNIKYGGGENEEEIKRIMNEFPERVREKHVNLIDFNTGERKEATDAFLLLENRDYITPDIDYYGVASNTEQTTRLRATFQIEEAIFILDHSFKSKGSGAQTFYHFIDSMDAVEDMIESVLEEGKPIKDTGIVESEDEGDYQIVVVDEFGEMIDIPVEKRELLESLVGIEVYKFEQEIIE